MSGSVFDTKKQTNTATSVPKAGGDNHVDTGGSAGNWGAITNNNFLSGPQAGQEQTLVKVGDQTAQVATGERKHDVFKDATTHVHEGDNKLFYHKNRETDVALSDNLIVHIDHTIDVTKKYKLIAKNVEITGLEEITLNVGKNYIKIDKKGITIFGTLVKIN